jgi:hypothetical protein
MTQVVEEFLSETLTLGITQLWLIERVVDNLQSFPITFCLQKLVHVFFGCTIAVSHDPSVVLRKPDLLQEDLDLTRGVVIDHLGNVLDGYSVFLVITTTHVAFSLSDE